MPADRPSSFGQDDALNFLVRTREEGDEPLWLGLLVQGTFVTGSLVSREDWARVVASSESTGNSEWAIRLLLQVPTPPSSLEADDGIEGQPEPSGRFAHLTEVTVYVGNQQIHLAAMRLRVDSVNSWAPIQKHKSA